MPARCTKNRKSAHDRARQNTRVLPSKTTKPEAEHVPEENSSQGSVTSPAASELSGATDKLYIWRCLHCNKDSETDGSWETETLVDNTWPGHQSWLHEKCAWCGKDADWNCLLLQVMWKGPVYGYVPPHTPVVILGAKSESAGGIEEERESESERATDG